MMRNSQQAPRHFRRDGVEHDAYDLLDLIGVELLMHEPRTQERAGHRPDGGKRQQAPVDRSCGSMAEKARER